MAANAVPGFRPSVHGLPFVNAFPPGPTVRLGPFDSRMVGFGDASAGLCGGMALTARDLYEAGVAAPHDLDGPPANGSPRFRAIVRRQVQSLDWLRVPLRYLDLQALRPDPPRGLARRLGREPARVEALLGEWPRIRAEIDSGHPSVTGLIRVAGGSIRDLTQNHQVLAWGWEADDGRVVIRVYDPNHPGRDDVELRIAITDAAGLPPGTPWRDRITMSQSTGEPLLGFFRQPYPRAPLARAWRSGTRSEGPVRDIAGAGLARGVGGPPQPLERVRWASPALAPTGASAPSGTGASASSRRAPHL